MFSILEKWLMGWQSVNSNKQIDLLLIYLNLLAVLLVHQLVSLLHLVLLVTVGQNLALQCHFILLLFLQLIIFLLF